MFAVRRQFPRRKSRALPPYVFAPMPPAMQDGVLGNREPTVRLVLPDLEPVMLSRWLVKLIAN
jgi:hypothetical protein